LPADVVHAGADFLEALGAAVLRGDVGEDRSHGHALSFDPAVHAIQERFIVYAARHRKLLRDVLRSSAEPTHRALAAEMLGYAADKKAIVPDLVSAMRDPDESTRNNATRALLVIATLAERAPERRLRIPPQPFIDLLDSLVWTDRNKSAVRSSSSPRAANLRCCLLCVHARCRRSSRWRAGKAPRTPQARS
jgi:hypothetical protein